mgnify:CR=1 FL=1
MNQNNQQAFEQLMAAIEAASGGIARDAGTRFETLVKDWLQNDPAYKDLFSKVETWAQWANAHHDLTVSAKDVGVDLVGTLADDPSSFAAIQCKFYKKEAIVPKAGIDSFIASSNRSCFKQRYLVATNENWTSNVQEYLSSIEPPPVLITRSVLANSQVDWSSYLSGEVVMRAKRTPRNYQIDAIKAVKKGFEIADRGKLIMACGTGKTYTSLKIAEEVAGERGLVIFLVPSLSLLSQTLTDWKQQCIFPIHAFAVCSDESIGKGDAEDLADLTKPSELAYPATTTARTLAHQVNRALEKKNCMVGIFSTYHSMGVVSEAQKEYGLPEIELVICDEAHRTSGGFYKDDDEKPFTRIHDATFIQAAKRLYMTATPKVFGAKVKEQQASEDIELYSMDDESVYGKTFHEITFSQAVQQYNCLVDYKVIVLTVSEDMVKDAYSYADIETGGIRLSDAAKVVGCWRALSKMDLQNDVSLGGDKQAMRRAVGFAQVIRPNDKYDRVSSMAFAENFNRVVEKFRATERNGFIKSHKDDPEAIARFDADYALSCETKHIDGSMNATEKDALLNWLREEPAEHVCKIIFNVRCLSEGVDVPALDSVLFLSPRKSMVDVVQTVGRVMRKAPGKTRGYVIIPIVIPAGISPDLVLDNNKDFDTVWQVLRALKSIDSNFGTMVDGQLGKIDSSKMEVICLSDAEIRQRGKKSKGNSVERKKTTGMDSRNKRREQQKEDERRMKEAQAAFDFGRNEILEDAIKAKIVKRVGNRREWEDWAEDVGAICKEQIKHINHVLETSESSRKSFKEFCKEIRETLNGELSDDDIVEMLGQHVVTKPVLDAFFEGYPFSEKNPIAKAMTGMVEKLDKEGLKKANELLKSFYEAVKIRMRKVKTQAERQTVIKELFEKFFKYAFPKQQEKLGIVYTPVEIVDFINQSVADILQKEFNTSIADEGVHILDPFTGTGTFMARLMQSGLIPKEQLPQKFASDMHANEIMPLAYYVSSMNLESVYYDLCPIADASKYEPNNVLILTDTFADHQVSDLFKTSLAENNERLAKVIGTDIRVIIGNPPYSVGQDSQNDNNQNEHYEKLDQRLAETYVAKTNSTLKGKLYDSYIRAYRWASDRIGDKGVIGFVTNAGWIDSNSADGMRKCMAEEFSEIWIWHLKGNQRTVGEQSRKEGGKVFGQGSRAPVAVVILVKNPEHKGDCQIHFAAVDDYLTREEKLEQTRKAGSVLNLKTGIIKPDAHGDWLNQRDDSYRNFMRMDGKKTTETPIFKNFSLGVNTSRDSWAYNSCSISVEINIKRSINFYNNQARKYLEHNISSEINLDPKEMKWDRPQKRDVFKGVMADAFSISKLYLSAYRPFFIQTLYFDSYWNNCVYQMPQLFPTNTSHNTAICVTGVGAKAFSCLMVDQIPCFDFVEKSQCFPRYLYKKVSEEKTTYGSLTGNLFDDPAVSKSVESERIDGYRRVDAITPEAMKHFQEAYPGKTISMDDLFYYIYGILHSEDYRQKYATNLMKELPRIPRVATYEDFMAFSEAGRKLKDLHVNFEGVPEYSGVRIIEDRRFDFSYRVTQMKYGKIPGKTGNAGKDKTKLVYNEFITVEGIPLEAQEYVVNKKSALDWIVERACVKTDKNSGIVNDFNDYAVEKNDRRYPLSLFLRVITVSLETMKIVKALPPLTIHELDAQ